MSKKALIVMLTWHDVTVPDAKEIFLSAKDAAAKDWGFKIEGTTPESMQELICAMKAAKKRVYVEVVAIDKPTCIRSAELCAKYGVDHLLGTLYSPEVQQICDNAGIDYSPFIALDEDTRLRRPIPQILKAAQEAEKESIWGVNLSAFRYLGGDPAELLRDIAPVLKKPLTIAGGVDTYEKMDLLKQIEPLYGFTIGGAFFEHKFADGFAEQID
ncbi:MAG: hypothetical protein RSC00_07775, partial [Ruthenibacterium sp.]